MEFDPALGDKPGDFAPFNTEPPPNYSGDSYAPQIPPPDASPTDGDMPPRIVAILPHRNDREIADEIFATMQRNDAARRAAESFNPYAEPNTEGDVANQGGQTQIAQALRPWSPYGDAAPPETGDGIWPAGWKDGKPPRQPKYPDTDGVEGVLPPRGGGKGGQSTESNSTPNVVVPRDRYPQGTQHIEDAIKKGAPDTLTIDRGGATARRSAAQRGTESKQGLDRDEYPPAMFEEGGEGASIQHIEPSQNRGMGACIGGQCRDLPDGTKVKIKVK